MRLPNASNTAKSILISLGIAALFVVANKPYPTSLIGTWQYKSILRMDTAVFPVGSHDTMVIRANGTFQYDLELANKHCSGTWQYSPKSKVNKAKLDKRIVLMYLPGNTVRVFEFVVLKNRKMVFCENGIYFEFAKK